MGLQWFSFNIRRSGRERLELARVHARLVRLEPRIGLAIHAELQALPQRLAALGVVEDPLLHVIEADALDVVHGALQVPAFLAVQLQEAAGIFQHLLRGPDLDQELRHLGLDAAVAAYVDFPARIDADHAHVLDARFRAVTRAAADRQLDLVRRVHAPQRALQVLAHLRAVLRAEAAPFRADAGLDRAQRLGVGMARGHADVLPDVLQVFLLHAQQVDALAARDLDGRDLVFVDRVGDAAQLAGRGLAPPHARDHAVGAVLLDVGVAAFVDVAALRVVLGLLGPGREQVVIDGRAARRAAVRRAPLHEVKDVGNGQQLVGPDGLAHLLVAVVGTAAQRLFLRRGRVVAAGCGHQQLLDQPGARAATRAGLGVLAHFVEREQALVLDRLADGALGDAVAAADLGIVRHGSGLAVALVAAVADVGFAEHQ